MKLEIVSGENDRRKKWNESPRVYTTHIKIDGVEQERVQDLFFYCSVTDGVTWYVGHADGEGRRGQTRIMKNPVNKFLRKVGLLLLRWSR